MTYPIGRQSGCYLSASLLPLFAKQHKWIVRQYLIDLVIALSKENSVRSAEQSILFFTYKSGKLIIVKSTKLGNENLMCVFGTRYQQLRHSGFHHTHNILSVLIFAEEINGYYYYNWEYPVWSTLPTNQYKSLIS